MQTWVACRWPFPVTRGKGFFGLADRTGTGVATGRDGEKKPRPALQIGAASATHPACLGIEVDAQRGKQR